MNAIITPDEGNLPEIKILAAVRFNKGRACVFNRSPVLKYERHGNFLIGRDGPFVNTYSYGTPSKNWEAFAGAKFNIPMVDGSVTKAFGQWWHSSSRGAVSVTYSTIESLKRCYVYTGVSCDPEHLKLLVENYMSEKGFYYDYYDFEKIINYDDLLSKKLTRERYFKRAIAHLPDHVRGAHSLLKAYHTEPVSICRPLPQAPKP